MARQQEEKKVAVSLTSTATASVPLKAENQVAQWRISELTRAGYSDKGAHTLGCAAHLDLHLAVAMRKQGCAEETALEILI